MTEKIVHIDTTPASKGRYIFGSAAVVIAESDILPQPKPGRKNKETIMKLTQNGLLSSLGVGMLGLQYITSGVGHPGFSFQSVETEAGYGWYTHARLMHFKNVSGNEMTSDPKEFFDAIGSPKNLNIISGVCLFGVSTVTAMTTSGNSIHITDAGSPYAEYNPLVSIHVDNQLHPSEVESILRLTHFLEFVGSETKKDLSFHIPGLEYKLFGLDLYLKGLMSPSVYAQWCGEVDKRSEALQKLLKAHLPKGMKVTLASPLQGVESLIQNASKMRKEEVMESIVGALKKESPVWKFLLRNDETLTPIDLAQKSYQAAYLKVAGSGKPTVAVENPNEVRIFENVRAELKAGSKKWFGMGGKPVSIIALYPHPNENIGPHAGINDRSYMLYLNTDGQTEELVKQIVVTMKGRRS